MIPNWTVDIFAKSAATKWDEKEWYCALLVYKAFSRTITGMRLEASLNPAFLGDTLGTIGTGFFVTPEDIVNSGRGKFFGGGALSQF